MLYKVRAGKAVLIPPRDTYWEPAVNIYILFNKAYIRHTN